MRADAPAAQVPTNGSHLLGRINWRFQDIFCEKRAAAAAAEGGSTAVAAVAGSHVFETPTPWGLEASR